MQDYVKIVRNLVQTGQEYLQGDTSKQPKEPPFQMKVDKSTTIMSAKCFNDSQLDIDRCMQVLTELIYLLNQGVAFTETEITGLFFAMTKLLQSENTLLRRLVYTVIKELHNQMSIYIVTSSLLKDIHHKNHHFRRNSLRTLPFVVDSTNIPQVDRYVKELLKDPDASVVQAAILSGLHFFGHHQEMVRKWATDITEKLTHSDPFVQCHALALLAQIKDKDANAFRKIIFSLLKNNFQELAAVQYLRLLKKASSQIEFISQEAKDYVAYLCKKIATGQDMVILEAAQISCQSPFLTNADLVDVVKRVEPFLASKSGVKKFAALRIFNSLLKNQTRKFLIPNSKELQKLLRDPNTSIASTAASVLLRTCREEDLQKLLTRMVKLMEEVSEDFKIDVLRSFRTILKTYPKNFNIVNSFIKASLVKDKSERVRTECMQIWKYQIEELGRQAKSSCFQVFLELLSLPGTDDNTHYAILGIINKNITKEDISNQLLVSLLNELYLKEGSLRACTLSALMQVFQHVDSDKKKILLDVMTKFKDDQDDEVKARIYEFQQSLRGQKKPSDISLTSLELKLIENFVMKNYASLQTSSEMLGMEEIKQWGQRNGALEISPTEDDTPNKQQDPEQLAIYRELFSGHSIFKDYGDVLKVVPATQLSDGEAELNVSYMLFIFQDNLIVKFKVINRLSETTELQNVTIAVSLDTKDYYQIIHSTSAKSINFKEAGECYVGLKKVQDEDGDVEMFPQVKFEAVVHYTVVESRGAQKKTYPDQFAIEGFEINLATFMGPYNIDPTMWGLAWSKMSGFTKSVAVQLAYASTQAAAEEVTKHLGMRKVDLKSDTSGKTNIITLMLAGKYLDRDEVLLTIMLAYDSKSGCLAKVNAQSKNQELVEELCSAL